MSQQRQDIQQQEYKEIDGFRDWKVFYDFIKDKYQDVSVALLRKDLMTLKETMRELIDNTYPYQSKSFKVSFKKLPEEIRDRFSDQVDDKGYLYLEYPDYYETLVSRYFETIAKSKEEPSDDPAAKERMSHETDRFVQESRRMRRVIMTDLSTSAIIPQAIKKKMKERASEMEGVGL